MESKSLSLFLVFLLSVMISGKFSLQPIEFYTKIIVGFLIIILFNACAEEMGVGYVE